MVSRRKIYDYFVMIYQPSHHRAVAAGFVPEQILIAEKQLGRPLSPDEDVRHVNGNTQDNSPSNLEIVSSNTDYKVQSIDGSELPAKGRKLNKTFMACKFQKQCWREIRAPIARANKVYLPYICSFQSEGDVYKCSHFWNYIDKELETQKAAGE